MSNQAIYAPFFPTSLKLLHQQKFDVHSGLATSLTADLALLLDKTQPKCTAYLVIQNPILFERKQNYLHWRHKLVEISVVKEYLGLQQNTHTFLFLLI